MIRLFVYKYPAVFILAFIVILAGWGSYNSLPREVMPEVKVPLIFINTIYPGVSAKDMETLITSEIEDELEGTDGIKKITSGSRQGVSMISVEFVPNTNVEEALRRVKEKVDIAKAEIPDDAEEPYVRELNFSDAPIMIIVLSHPAGLEVLENSVDFLEEEIKRVKGVLDVKISGQLEKELAIEVDPVKLLHYGFSLDDVIKSVTSENITIPGGILKNPVRNYTLSVSGEIKEPEHFKDIVVSARGIKVKLGDIADVGLKYKDKETVSRLNGQPCVSLAITKRAGDNLVAMAENIKKIVKDNNHRFVPGTQIDFSLDQSKQVGMMNADLVNNILTALVLVLGVTLLFLGITNSLFVSFAIPLSMLISFFVIQLMGITLNMFVLFSLILALGMLVDNGIVIVENIFRHGMMGKSRVDASIEGTTEVALPIITSTLTTILAFFPIIYMPGIMGDVMSYLPKTVIIVLTSSLLVALTLNPVLCSKFLKISEKQRKKVTEGGSVFKKVQDIYIATLTRSLRYPVLLVLFFFVFVMAGIILNGKFGKEVIFFPNIDPEATNVSIEAPNGTPLDVTDSMIWKVESLIESMETSAEFVQTTTGQATGQMLGPADRESYYGNIRIGFLPFLDRKIKGQKTTDELKEKVKTITGIDITVRKQEGGPPQGHPISYEVTGMDYEVMGVLADSVESIIREHEYYMENIGSDFESAKPQLKVDINREKAAHFGLSTMKIALTIRRAMNGGEISKLRMGKEEYDVNIRYKGDFRMDLNALRNLEIIHEGNRIPLSSVADIRDETEIGVIKRKNLQRNVEVYADFKVDITGKDSVKKLVSARVKKLQVPKGYHINIGEGEEMQAEATAFLMKAFGIALGLIIITLVIQFNSITQPIIIIAAVFMSLGGIFWGYFLSGMAFVVIMSGIGTISLAGIVVNNGIVLIDFINQLQQKGMVIEQAIIEGGRARLRPVLLTAITTILGLLPMALGFSFDFTTFQFQLGTDSSQWWMALAWTIIFGLSLATILTLIVVPLLILLDHRFRVWVRKMIAYLHMNK
ncbi:MAG: efflux RND transporter permease subunit [Fibrobacteria bacterium]|nr:efflux RND transporter permease subunit [Fibrobacteria bacterium]